MKQNKLLNNKYNSGDAKYCSKCLSLLGDVRVRDNERNEFCSESCRREYWSENRKLLEEIMGKF